MMCPDLSGYLLFIGCFALLFLVLFVVTFCALVKKCDADKPPEIIRVDWEDTKWQTFG